MADKAERGSIITPTQDYSGSVVAIVAASWHEEIVERLVDGAYRCLDKHDVRNVLYASVPGCFELPLACRSLASLGYIDAIAALGVVVRGETIHFDLVAQGAAQGIQRVQLDVGLPIGLGVLAVENTDQALQRSGEDDTNVGYAAMEVALVMTGLTQSHRLVELEGSIKSQLGERNLEKKLALERKGRSILLNRGRDAGFGRGGR